MKTPGWMTAGACAVAAGVIVTLTAGQSLAGDERAGTRVSGDQCVYSPLEDSTVIDRSTLLLTDRSGRALLLHMSGPCLTPNQPIGLEFYGSRRVCDRMDVTVTGDVASVVPMRCMIDTVEPLTREQALAYKAKR